MSAPLTIRAFARLDGCDESLVRRAIRTGRLARDEAGKLDPALAGTGWPSDRPRCSSCGQFTDDPPGRAGPRAGTLDAERARLTAAKAEAAERTNARERGELVDRAVIDSAMHLTIGHAVSRLGLLGAQIAGSDIKLRKRIEAGVHDALVELASTTTDQLLGQMATTETEDDDAE